MAAYFSTAEGAKIGSKDWPVAGCFGRLPALNDSTVIGRDMLACLPTGYGKSLINLPPVRVAAELSVVYNSKDLFSTEPVVDESHCVNNWKE